MIQQHTSQNGRINIEHRISPPRDKGAIKIGMYKVRRLIILLLMSDGLPHLLLQPPQVPQTDASILAAAEQLVRIADAHVDSHDGLFVGSEAVCHAAAGE